ncbi:MAG: 30S ribosomal protein S6e [Nanoarchaeota archaeon]|nr:30S ribosomal protein S6e [Nanoarchaeota archaeon]
MKLIVSLKNGKSYQKEFETHGKLLNKKIGEKFSGEDFGLKGYELLITGGSDKSGFPLRKDVQGSKRQRVLLSGGVGFKPKRKGERRKKTVRGNTISEEVIQVNTKIVKEGKEKVPKLWGVESKPEKETKSEEIKKEEPQKEKTVKKEEVKPKKEEPEKETKSKEVKKEKVKEEPKPKKESEKTGENKK